MVLVLRPSAEEFARPFRQYVEGVFREHPDIPVFKVVPPEGWSPHPGRELDFEGVTIGTPIKQHVVAREQVSCVRASAGAWHCLLEEQPSCTVAEFKKLAAERDEQRFRGRPAPTGEEEIVASTREFWKDLTTNPPVYGSDTPISFFDRDLAWGWNMRALGDLLQKPGVTEVPGVTTPMAYFGMWKSFFSWHVEDMDLYSMNYIHTGKSKVWYCVSPRDRGRFEAMAAALFPRLHAQCPAFLRHKTVLISRNTLREYSVPFVEVAQHANEFVVLNASAYHAGYNLGFNCAEAINFATCAWPLDGIVPTKCKCQALDQPVHINAYEILPEELAQELGFRRPGESETDSEAGEESGEGSESEEGGESGEEEGEEEGAGDSSASHSGSASAEREAKLAAHWAVKLQFGEVAPEKLVPTLPAARPRARQRAPAGRKEAPKGPAQPQRKRGREAPPKAPAPPPGAQQQQAGQGQQQEMRAWAQPERKMLRPSCMRPAVLTTWARKPLKSAAPAAARSAAARAAAAKDSLQGLRRVKVGSTARAATSKAAPRQRKLAAGPSSGPAASTAEGRAGQASSAPEGAKTWGPAGPQGEEGQQAGEGPRGGAFGRQGSREGAQHPDSSGESEQVAEARLQGAGALSERGEGPGAAGPASTAEGGSGAWSQEMRRLAQSPGGRRVTLATAKRRAAIPPPVPLGRWGTKRRRVEPPLRFRPPEPAQQPPAGASGQERGAGPGAPAAAKAPLPRWLEQWEVGSAPGRPRAAGAAAAPQMQPWRSAADRAAVGQAGEQPALPGLGPRGLPLGLPSLQRAMLAARPAAAARQGQRAAQGRQSMVQGLQQDSALRQWGMPPALPAPSPLFAALASLGAHAKRAAARPQPAAEGGAGGGGVAQVVDLTLDSDGETEAPPGGVPQRAAPATPGPAGLKQDAGQEAPSRPAGGAGPAGKAPGGPEAREGAAASAAPKGLTSLLTRRASGSSTSARPRQPALGAGGGQGPALGLPSLAKAPSAGSAAPQQQRPSTSQELAPAAALPLPAPANPPASPAAPGLAHSDWSPLGRAAAGAAVALASLRAPGAASGAGRLLVPPAAAPEEEEEEEEEGEGRDFAWSVHVSSDFYASFTRAAAAGTRAFELVQKLRRYQDGPHRGKVLVKGAQRGPDALYHPTERTWLEARRTLVPVRVQVDTARQTYRLLTKHDTIYEDYAELTA